ncbi:MAG: hypothetical protein M1832_002042 [Thelocarpon impressellum]|nr:MAG: hypothetical protein M1832_002042 [Thelocarpon impressellum]
MHFSKSLLVGVSAMAGFAAAQSSLAFTSIFSSVTAGQDVPLTYTGDLTTPVTISLRQGPSNNLGAPTVLTSSTTGGSFTWKVDSTLPSGNDYALQITQGGATNFIGPFSLAGAGPASASSSISASASASSSLVSSFISSISSSLNSTFANATSITVGPLVTGTGSPTSANTTFSSATLTSTATETTSEATTSTGTSTGTSAVPTRNSAVANGVSSPLALVLTAIVAMIYLN